LAKTYYLSAQQSRGNSAFGAASHIRLSYATSMANLEKGLERIERFCKTLMK